ncbi:MAG: iron-siderophore ABC transporter substrate-binding protein, partial [Gammaproteobacteria bacterium]
VLNNSVVLGTALLLDVPIVGYPVAPYKSDLLPYFDKSKLAAARNVVGAGSVTQPNIEAVAATRPDLIIGTTAFIDEYVYNRLVEIAPTVVFEHNTNDPEWKEPLRRTATVFQGTATIEKRMAEYEGRVEEIRTALGEQSEIREVTLANLRALGDIRISSAATCSGATLEELGFTRPPGQRGTEEIKLSIERLRELDADALLYYVGSTATDPEEAAQAVKVITSHPLWDTLGVVQSGQVFQVDPDHWFTCGTLQAQHLILDDIERIFLGNPQ